jgi:HTH-type transcriptional regulator / antitoxin HigA
MNIKPLRTDEDYRTACERIDEIFNAELGTQEDDELEILLTPVDRYEEINFKIRMPHPIEAIKTQMEHLNISRKRLMGCLNKSSGRISDILNCRRSLTLKDIRRLSELLHIPISVLSHKYELVDSSISNNQRDRECCTTC